MGVQQLLGERGTSSVGELVCVVFQVEECLRSVERLKNKLKS